jgi:1-acyl-sn-glycerol-3-phosphate acyltransferase
MDRYPYAEPPRWWSPRPRRFWMRLWHPIRRYQQRHDHHIRRIDVEGLEHVQGAIRAGQGVLITPNHAGHGDCYLLLEALSRLRCPSYIMTAWQVFYMMSRWQQLAYRQHGCFSINREGRDLRAFRKAVETLSRSSSPLVVFPEGEVYHLNDWVTPFREGVSMIAAAAVRQSGRPVACVPCALKYFYTHNPAADLLPVIQQIERKLEVKPDKGATLAWRVERLQEKTLACRERQYGLGSDRAGTPDGNLEDRRDRLIESILLRLETKYAAARDHLAVPERVKQLRQKMIVPPYFASRGGDLEDAFVAVQLFSYRFGYVSGSPTIERIAETVDKLEEDVLGLSSARIRGTRRGVVRFGDPLLLHQAADRQTCVAHTDQLQERVQQLIDQILNEQAPLAPPAATYATAVDGR